MDEKKLDVQDIARIAEDELKKLDDISELPVSVYDVAKKNDIEVYVYDFKGKGQGKDKDISGLLQERDKKWEILVNKSDIYTRQRFTIAHELGHFILHRNKEFTDTPVEYEIFYRSASMKSYRQEEREANIFAANLLMPQRLMEDIYYNKRIRNIDDLKNVFAVSAQAMAWRLEDLDFLRNLDSL